MTNAVNLANAAPSINGSSGNLTITGSMVAGSSYAWRNRIINGAMVIDQRNAGASVTPSVSAYTIDRWLAVISVASKFSVQQSTSVVPTGFTQSAAVTSLSAYTLSSSDFFFLTQFVEGFNWSDMGWGTAAAKTATLSFWVRSSLTGTFSVLIRAGGDDNAYPATYTINTANTWEQKTITIVGPTSGTFYTDNRRGVGVWFSLGTGSAYASTPNQWGGNLGATGAINLVSTNGATFYVTGVQLEVGTVATPFERRDYGRELAMCQRYYEKSYNAATAPGSNIASGISGQSAFAATNNDSTGGAISGFVPFQTAKRSAPTTARFWDLIGNLSRVSNDSASNNKSIGAGAVFTNSGEWGYQYDFGVASASNARAYWCWDVSSEL